MTDLSERLFTLKKAMKIKKDALAKELGVSRTMLYNYEQNDPVPPHELLATLGELEKKWGIERGFTSPSPSVLGAARTRHIPVIGMAHAGEAQSYEEIPCDPHDYVPTECKDDHAFAVRLEGDSMEPEFKERDLLILMPSRRIYSNCLAVLRLANDGVVFRRVEVRGDKVKLVPLNTRYDVEEISMSQVTWAYPVYGMWRQITV